MLWGSIPTADDSENILVDLASSQYCTITSVTVDISCVDSTCILKQSTVHMSIAIKYRNDLVSWMVDHNN